MQFDESKRLNSHQNSDSSKQNVENSDKVKIVLEEKEEEEAGVVEPVQNARRSTRIKTQLGRLNEYDIFLGLEVDEEGNLIKDAMLA